MVTGRQHNMYLLTNADLKDQIDELYKGNYNYNTTTDVGLVVNTINTNYGVLNILLSADMPTDQLVAFDQMQYLSHFCVNRSINC